jgi:acyl-CoA thioester hydrolase
VSEPHLPVLRDRILEVLVRVNYSEVDQMGVVYHARYLVWLDIARTEYLRQTGLSYRDLEAQGFRLVVAEVAIRYLRGAAYDDAIRVRCWVRDLASRRVTFGYTLVRVADGELLATATTAMFVLDASMRPTRLPAEVGARLVPIPDPVRP